MKTSCLCIYAFMQPWQLLHKHPDSLFFPRSTSRSMALGDDVSYAVLLSPLESQTAQVSRSGLHCRLFLTRLSGFTQTRRILGTLQQLKLRNTFTTWNGNDDFFRFEGGRFIRNEEQELAKRNFKFDVDKLAQRAAATGNRKARHTVKIEKLKDGLNSRVLLLVMSDGSELVAKVPYPCAGKPGTTTASEVATMVFVSAAACF